MKFKNETLIKRAMDIASKIYFNNNKLENNGYTENLKWKQKGKSLLSEEEFKTLVNNESKFYSKLREYKDELLYRVMRKDIDKEEYKLALDKINSLRDGTYKEKYNY